MPSTFRSIKTHNDADQLVSERVQKGTNDSYTISYSYNDNGGLKTVSQASQPALSYAYDYNNRLKNADDASNSVEYLYDASGARIGRIQNSVTNYYVVDYVDGLKRPLAETDASGTISRYYVWSGSKLLCHIEADGTTRYYHADELGSTLALTDETGSLAAEFAYMPYGHATANYLTPNTSNITPFLWLGGYGVYYDSTTDLHLTLHRAYSSKLKRFISPDPLGIDGGVNVYMWANMNPLWFVDPYGLCAESHGANRTGNSLMDNDQVRNAIEQAWNQSQGEYVSVPSWLQWLWSGETRAPREVAFNVMPSGVSELYTYNEDNYVNTPNIPGVVVGGHTHPGVANPTMPRSGELDYNLPRSAQDRGRGRPEIIIGEKSVLLYDPNNEQGGTQYYNRSDLSAENPHTIPIRSWKWRFWRYVEQ